MRKPSPRLRPHTVHLYRYRPGQDPDAGAVADESSSIALGVSAFVQAVDVGAEVVNRRLRQTTVYDVYLYADYGLTAKDLIVWTDRAGTRHSLLVTGQLLQPGGIAVWKVRAQEVV